MLLQTNISRTRSQNVAVRAFVASTAASISGFVVLTSIGHSEWRWNSPSPRCSADARAVARSISSWSATASAHSAVAARLASRSSVTSAASRGRQSPEDATEMAGDMQRSPRRLPPEEPWPEAFACRAGVGPEASRSPRRGFARRVGCGERDGPRYICGLEAFVHHAQSVMDSWHLEGLNLPRGQAVSGGQGRCCFAAIIAWALRTRTNGLVLPKRRLRDEMIRFGFHDRNKMCLRVLTKSRASRLQ